MSSPPHSLTETPSKPIMAVDNENVTIKAPSSDTPSNTASKQQSSEKTVKESLTSLDTQVPSSPLQFNEEHGTADEDVFRVEQLPSDSSESLTIVTEEDREIEAEATEADFNNELTDMDWPTFQERYRSAIAEANDKETKLLEEFEKYFEVGH